MPLEQDDLKLQFMRLLDESLRHYDLCDVCRNDATDRDGMITCDLMLDYQLKKDKLRKQLNEFTFQA
jgi:hypothetical protein